MADLDGNASSVKRGSHTHYELYRLHYEIK